MILIVTSIILLHHAESLHGQTPSPRLARRADNYNYETCIKDPDGISLSLSLAFCLSLSLCLSLLLWLQAGAFVQKTNRIACVRADGCGMAFLVLVTGHQ